MLGGFTWTEKYEEAISDEHPPGFISDSFKESGNLLYLMASLFQLVSSSKEVSLFFTEAATQRCS